MKELLKELGNDYLGILKNAYKVISVLLQIGCYLGVVYGSFNVLLVLVIQTWWIQDFKEFLVYLDTIATYMGYVFMAYLLFKLLDTISQKMDGETDDIEEEKEDERTEQEV